jgi:hypothetical protein
MTGTRGRSSIVRWAEDYRLFEVITATANAVLRRFINDLARVPMDLAALLLLPGEEDAAVQ